MSKIKGGDKSIGGIGGIGDVGVGRKYDWQAEDYGLDTEQ